MIEKLNTRSAPLLFKQCKIISALSFVPEPFTDWFGQNSNNLSSLGGRRWWWLSELITHCSTGTAKHRGFQPFFSEASSWTELFIPMLPRHYSFKKKKRAFPILCYFAFSECRMARTAAALSRALGHFIKTQKFHIPELMIWINAHFPSPANHYLHSHCTYSICTDNVSLCPRSTVKWAFWVESLQQAGIIARSNLTSSHLE